MAICYEVGRPVPTRSPERERIGALIKQRRIDLRMSQEAMARRVGLTLAGYRPWEYGERDMKSEDLPAWADALQLTHAELANRLGLGSVSVGTIFAAEISEMIERADDPATAEELMTAIRAIARLTSRNRPPANEP